MRKWEGVQVSETRKKNSSSHKKTRGGGESVGFFRINPMFLQGEEIR